MEHLWAPWRATYLLHEKPRGCFFCQNPARQDGDGRTVSDADTHLLLRGKTCFAMLNAFPYTGGHLMVAPYRHTGELNDLGDEEAADLFRVTRRCKNLLAAALKPQGFNIGLNLGSASGAGVAEHLHMHVVPRWNGDTNFMTVLSDARVVSQGLRETYELLMKHLPSVPE